MLARPVMYLPAAVALLAEGVGRNLIGAMVAEDELNVALLAEGVGRNSFQSLPYSARGCRPPRGGRG